MIYAMKLALEALEQLDGIDTETECVTIDVGDVITALREALAEQPAQQELVCIGYWNQKTGAYYKPDQISAAHKKLIEDGILRLCYTSPPAQRKPLTDEEIGECIDKVNTTSQYSHHHFGWHLQFARAIEAAHGIGEKK